MDAYHQQHQEHHRYMRPPQPPLGPPSADPLHYVHHQPRPPVPLQAAWYSNQFQYNRLPPPPPSSHTPSPPPPQQWAAPPHSDHLPPPPPLPSSSYPPQLPHPYPAHHLPPNHQFLPPPPPPRPNLPPPPPPTPPPPPPPPPHSQFPQSYPQVDQEWGNANWGQHQGWDCQAHNNVEDWAARARAWAAQKAAMEDQHPQQQFTQVNRMEEQNRYNDQYQQIADSRYQDIQQPLPISGYQQYPASAAPSNQQPIVYSQENGSFSSVHSSNDGCIPYIVGGGSSFGAPTTSPSVLQQEVPSSYSSVAGKEEATDPKDQQYKSLPLPISSVQEGRHHVQSPQPAFGGSVVTEQPFAYGNQGVDTTADLSNPPLVFASNFGRDHDPHTQSSYGTHHDSVGNVGGHAPVSPLPWINSWAPAVATGAIYPPIPPALSSGHQHDPSVAIPSVPGHAAPPFGSFPGPSFQPAIPSAGVSYGPGSGTVPLPSTGFPVDVYGASNVSERPKKASVPNWLKEEIIKNASVITRSSLEHAKEEMQPIEDEGVEKSFGKNDQEDSKSIDSPKSTEEEDENEDDTEAARTAAINQEIKRVLTEVLLKVTDELFDEIATKVLHEDDMNDDEVQTPKASAKVLVPVKAKDSETENISEKSSSSAPGNVLGLANYASDEDDDEEEEIKSTTMSTSTKNNVLQQPSIPKISEELHGAVENGSSSADIGNDHGVWRDLESGLIKTSNIESRRQKNSSSRELRDNKYSSKLASGTSNAEIIIDVGKISHTSNGSGSKAASGKTAVDDSQVRETRMKRDEYHQHERKRNCSSKEKDNKEAEYGSRKDEKGDGNRRKQDEKYMRKHKSNDLNVSKERTNEQTDKTDEKAKESGSRKRSSDLDVKDRTESEIHRSSAKEDDNRKQGHGKDKEEDRARHKPTRDSSRHKRRRSSSTSSRGRNSKDNNSSDEASDGSKSKLRSRKRNLSPSPVRSRRSQVSRSPHSKRSQRRHSPYSSLDTMRYVSVTSDIVLMFLRYTCMTVWSTGESIRLHKFSLNVPRLNNSTNYFQGKEIKVQITHQAAQMNARLSGRRFVKLLYCHEKPLDPRTGDMANQKFCSSAGMRLSSGFWSVEGLTSLCCRKFGKCENL